MTATAPVSWGYIRISAQSQQTTRQEEAMRQAGIPEARIFRDVITGSTMDRPALNKMLDGSHVQPGMEIVVDGYDRLGRTVLGALQTLEMLSEKGITVRSVKASEQDLQGANGKMFRSLLLVLAEWERDMNRERVAEARAARIAEGRPMGRPRTALSDTKVQKIRALRAGGWSVAKIVADKELAVSRASVYRALQDA